MEGLDADAAIHWVNTQVSSADLRIETPSDLASGEVLLALMDALARPLTPLRQSTVLQSGKSKFVKIDNLAKVLEAVSAASGLSVAQYSPLDLVSSLEMGDANQMLEILWKLILKYDAEAARDPGQWVANVKRKRELHLEALQVAEAKRQQEQQELIDKERAQRQLGVGPNEVLRKQAEDEAAERERKQREEGERLRRQQEAEDAARARRLEEEERERVRLQEEEERREAERLEDARRRAQEEELERLRKEAEEQEVLPHLTPSP
ncbi:hypothetical protein CYMTET_29553 [Cymbomonas tetramitiformis]|uniref:Calponin-homology (CH) domain-containing protein n=1 Tax=Cymbomonas tetramitiformis TaxID=36881 RepID=A0AAE0KUT1_9CHLO|nr:hypothetical protein CYMTET_29553 [Cymbomonas tetramitiformis]